MVFHCGIVSRSETTTEVQRIIERQPLSGEMEPSLCLSSHSAGLITRLRQKPKYHMLYCGILIVSLFTEYFAKKDMGVLKASAGRLERCSLVGKLMIPFADNDALQSNVDLENSF